MTRDSKRKRVALVTYHFPPEQKVGGRRSFQLRTHLPSLGWDVRVLCSRLPDGGPREDAEVLEVARGKLGEWVRALIPADERPLFEQWSGTPTSGAARSDDSVWSRSLRVARGLILPDEYLPWVAFALHAAMKDPEILAADVVLATAPPYSAHVVGFLLARKLGVPLVVDYRDPYTLNSVYPSGTLNRPLRQAMERKVMTYAARVTAASEGFARGQSELGDVPVFTIRNGWSPSIHSSSTPPRLASPDATFVVVHTGTIYEGLYDLDALVDGIGLALERGVHLEVHSCGLGGRFLARAFAEKNLSQIFQDFGVVEAEEAVAMRAGASVTLLFLPGRDVGDGVIPAKIYDYILSARPVLALGPVSTEPGRLLADAGAGPVVEDAQGVASRLELLAAAQAAGRLEEHAVPESGAAKYSGRAMAESFVRLLDEIVGA